MLSSSKNEDYDHDHDDNDDDDDDDDEIGWLVGGKFMYQLASGEFGRENLCPHTPVLDALNLAIVTSVGHLSNDTRVEFAFDINGRLSLLVSVHGFLSIFRVSIHSQEHKLNGGRLSAV
ncbi:hypothetical protein T11_13166 [Trichinella zimbabwensis]|uniref:Uncharacterized protein n=1 Tax=Trichinella zimbabwensis TaxID=268475 RepID=A0A0V1HHH4_9BILA|nr:hypothetical protein T11_13166 [Trichinella zimbabwensis]